MKSYKYLKKSIIAYVLVSILILFAGAFASGYSVGRQLGYEQGKSENDVVVSSVLKNLMANKNELKKLLDSKEGKYVAFGEVVENNSANLVLMNIFGIQRTVLKTNNVNNFQDLVEGDRIFVVGEPNQDGSLESRFYKKLDLPALRLFKK